MIRSHRFVSASNFWFTKTREPSISCGASAASGSNEFICAAAPKDSAMNKMEIISLMNLSRENLADHVFNRPFLDINVRHGQFVQQRLACRNDAVAFDFERDGTGCFFDDLTVTRQIFRRIFIRLVTLDRDEFEISEAVHDFAQLAVEENFSVIDYDDALAQRLDVGHVMAR